MLKFAPMSAPCQTHPAAVQSIRTSIGVWLIALCLVGTQLLGLLHSVAHAGTNQVSDSGATVKVVYATEHNCVLFDALTLSNCAGPATTPSLPAATIGFFFLARLVELVLSADPLGFQSRAPPAPLS